LSDVFNEDTCQKIEDKSNAVLIRDNEAGRLVIQGSDQLHVLLALSIVEDIVARYETNVSESTHNSSTMLDKMLQQVYLNDSEAEDGCDWSTMPEEVKRAVLVSLFDNDVSEINVDGENITDKQAGNQESTDENDTSSTSKGSEVVVLSCTPDISDRAIQPLVKLAISKEYSREEIANVLKKSNQWKESEFLRALHTNRRMQSAAREKLSASGCETLQQPGGLNDCITSGAQCRFTDQNTYSFTAGRSPEYFVIAPKNSGFCNAGTSSVPSANVVPGMHEISMDIDEVNTTELSIAAADDSVILLKSDNELNSSDDDNSENMEVRRDISARLVALAKDSLVTDKIIDEAVASANTKRKRKRKKKKKQPLPDTAEHQKETPSPVTIKTGYEINDLDSISLVAPSSAAAAADLSASVVIVEDDSDSDIMEIPENIDSVKPVDGSQKQWQIADQQQVQNSYRALYPGGTNRITSVVESYRNPSRLEFPAPAFTSVPAVSAGNLNVDSVCYLSVTKISMFISSFIAEPSTYVACIKQ